MQIFQIDIASKRVTSKPSLALLKESQIGKCQVHPRIGHEGPREKYRFSCTISLTSALLENHVVLIWARDSSHVTIKLFVNNA
jgi:hypothetical protein